MESTAGRLLEERSKPEVSIIILVLEDVTRLLSCLASIDGTSADVTYETIVVANGTAPELLDSLAQSPVRVVPLSFNVGFAAGCNIGAHAALGELLVFLNDDTSVSPDWLGSLVSAARASQDVGAVGSKLLNDDGSLQEAGGVVWRSGRTDRMSVSRPSDLVDMARDVDYASACGLLVKREPFWQVGGFDEAFFPAYYEDVDLSFSLRAIGLRVVYEPRAEVLHEGSVSSKQGFRNFAAERNRRRFVAKWRGDLDRRDEMPPDEVLSEAIVRTARRPPAPRTTSSRAEPEPEVRTADECQLFHRSVAALEQHAALQADYIDELETELANLDFERRRLSYIRGVLGKVPFAGSAGRWLGTRVRAQSVERPYGRPDSTPPG